jgi:cell wall-associated NlpC family hydrolase
MNKISGIAVSSLVAGGLVLTMATDSQAATTLRSKAEAVAKKQIGDPYKYGATGPSSFDCSGLNYYSYNKVGKRLPRTAQGQYNSSHKVSPSGRKPGDLIFIGNSSRSIYHTGIYAGFWSGHGWMLDAPKPGRTVGYHQIRYYTGGAPRAYYGRY